jgi:hypothetical protein
MKLGSDKYEKKLKIQVTFADALKVSMTNTDKPKEKAAKKKQ